MVSEEYFLSINQGRPGFLGIRAEYRGFFSLRGRRLKGKGKRDFGARETRRAREEGGRKGNACQENIVFAIPPTNYVCKNNTTVND